MKKPAKFVIYFLFIAIAMAILLKPTPSLKEGTGKINIDFANADMSCKFVKATQGPLDEINVPIIGFHKDRLKDILKTTGPMAPMSEKSVAQMDKGDFFLVTINDYSNFYTLKIYLNDSDSEDISFKPTAILTKTAAAGDIWSREVEYSDADFFIERYKDAVLDIFTVYAPSPLT